MLMSHKREVRALVVTGCAAALLLGGGPALASGQASATSITGPEAIAGALHGQAALANTTVLPVTFSGVLSTHGTVRLDNSTSKTHSIPSPLGVLVVQGTGYKHQTQTENKKTCQFSFTQDLTFSVLGGKSTGAFAGASGPGAAKVNFTAFEPRYTSGKNKGQCNGNARPLSKGAAASFLATVVLTVKS